MNPYWQETCAQWNEAFSHAHSLPQYPITLMSPQDEYRSVTEKLLLFEDIKSHLSALGMPLSSGSEVWGDSLRKRRYELSWKL